MLRLFSYIYFMNIESLYTLFLESNSVCTDTRKLKKNDIFFALKGDNFNGNKFAEDALKKGAIYAVIDEVAYENKQTILVSDVLRTLQELALYHRKQLNIPIIALTGSNGKTTTKELINAVLSQNFKTTATSGNFNNHIGVPLTLLSMTGETEIGIVEMGANHQKEIEFLCNIARPDYGLITNFGKAHLEGFGGIQGVIKGKSELYVHLKAHNKIVFINTNDETQVKQTGSYPNVVKYGSRNDNNCVVKFNNADPFVVLNYKNLTIKSNLVGQYNFGNIASAIAIGDYFKISAPKIKEAIEGYNPKNNRSEILKVGDTEIVLDAYNANPTSMSAAIFSFHKLKRVHKVAFLGDMFELGDESIQEHQKIVDLIRDLDIDKVILIGEHFSKTKLVSDNKLQAFITFDEFKNEFDFTTTTSSSILIKGSRGMAMERILDLL